MPGNINYAAAAAGAAAPEPIAERATPASRAGVEGGKERNESPDSATVEPIAKALATAQAKAALCGCSLLCRWGMSKEVPCLRAVGDLLRRMGAPR